MDEFCRTPKRARRFALAVLIGCAATASGSATLAIGQTPAAQNSTLRSLLINGWDDTQPVGADEKSPAPEQTATNAETATKTAVESDAQEAAAIIRPQLRVLEVRQFDVESAAPAPQPLHRAAQPYRAPQRLERTPMPKTASRSLAALIQEHARPIEAQQSENAKQPAPAVKTAETLEQPQLAELPKSESTAEAKVAAATQGEKTNATTPPTVPAPTQKKTDSIAADIQRPETSPVQDDAAGAAVENAHPEALAQSDASEPLENATANASLAQSIAPVAPESLSESTAPLDQIETAEPLPPKVATESIAASPKAVESAEPAAQQEPANPIPAAAPAEQALADMIGSQATGDDKSPIASDKTVAAENDTWLGVDKDTSADSQLSRRVAQDSGFGLLPLEDLQAETALALPVAKLREESLTATIHATRLRELAQQSIRQSHHRLERGAIHSAKRFAVEALHSIVAMRDAQAGGNHHAKHLESAFDAIRESEDFGGRFVAVDQNALKRVVAVHKTGVLQSRDLDHVSALEATDAYLAAAKSHFVMAGGNVPEASEALVLLGEIEKKISRPNDARSAAVAVALQRAAVEISPSSARGFRALGNTLMQQGLVQQAAGALHHSLQIQPTRSGYEKLLLAAQRLGDVDTIRSCRESLTQLPEHDTLPVHNLTPAEFASTYRPDPIPVQTSDVKPAPARAAKSREADKPRISVRSLFPFTRR